METLSQIPVIGGVLVPLLAFLIVLSIVVFVHELGHYLVGRWCGIGAEVFSIGFGTPLVSRVDRRGTRWQVAALPLGGYVKFIGDTDPASAGPGHDEGLTPTEREMAFHHAPLGARALTVVAGPVANFLLSIVLFAGIGLWVGQGSEEPVIGDVTEEAREIGFRAGDRVLSIDGEEVESFADILTLMNRSEGEPIPARVVRGGDTTTIEVAYRSGVEVGVVQPGMPASRAGIAPGDRVVSIGGEPVNSFYDLQVVGAELPPGERVEVTVMRDGEELSFELLPDLRERTHPVTGERAELPTLGIGPADFIGLVPERLWMGPGEAVLLGFERTTAIIVGTITFLGDLIFANADESGLGGPIGIAQISGEKAEQGIGELIALIAVISTSIGLINLFPIPILDGGHLMFYAIEAVRGRPLGEAWMQIGNVIGLSLVLFLMVFATYNDLSRL
jgi:regulator of sigma E protease